MQQVLNSLLNLQELDEQLGELDRSKVYLPEMINNVNNEIVILEKEYQENKDILLEAQIKQKQIEIDVESDKEALEKYSKQMKVIKTNKEYDALIAEIDQKKQNINPGILYDWKSWRDKRRYIGNSEAYERVGSQLCPYHYTHSFSCYQDIF